MPGRNLQKIKQMLSNTLRLKFCYLKIIPVLLLCYHQKLIRYILKSNQKNKCGCIHEKCGCIFINHNENKGEKEK